MYSTNQFYRYIENANDRLDQHFLNPIWDINIERMRKNNFLPLEKYLDGDIFSGVSIKQEQAYTLDLAPSNSINFIQIGSIDLKGNIAAETDYKVEAESVSEAKLVKKNDLLFAATGATIGKVGIYNSDKPSIACGDILTVRLIDDRYAELVHFFMLTAFGYEQIVKHIFGSTNGHIKSSDISNILVPALSEKLLELFVREVAPLKEAYFRTKQEANSLLLEIDYLLLQELCWNNSFESLPAAEFSHSFYRYQTEITTRLDSLYNDIVFDRIFQNIESSPFSFIELFNYVNLRVESRNPQEKPDEHFDYVDIGSIETLYGKMCPTRMKGNEATSSRMRQVMYANDILVSTTRPTRRAIAIVPDSLDNQICSTGFAVLTPKKGVCKEFLFYILRSEIVTAQFERLCSGSGYPAINKENDVLRVLVPDVEPDTQDRILSKLRPKLDLAKKYELEAEKKWDEAKQKFNDIALLV